MSEAVSNTNKAPKKSWFKGLKSEFSKIIWEDKKTITKQTVAVVSISIVLGLVIAVLDMGLQYGLEFLINL